MSDWYFQIFDDFPILNIALLLLSGVFALLYLRVSARIRRLSKNLSLLENEFRAMNSGHLGMGRKILKVSQDIAGVESLREKVTSSDKSEKIYQQAGLLLSRGATIEEVVEACDVAPAEAELLAVMQHSASPDTRAA